MYLSVTLILFTFKLNGLSEVDQMKQWCHVLCSYTSNSAKPYIIMLANYYKNTHHRQEEIWTF